MIESALEVSEPAHVPEVTLSTLSTAEKFVPKGTAVAAVGASLEAQLQYEGALQEPVASMDLRDECASEQIECLESQSASSKCHLEDGPGESSDDGDDGPASCMKETLRHGRVKLTCECLPGTPGVAVDDVFPL